MLLHNPPNIINYNLSLPNSWMRNVITFRAHKWFMIDEKNAKHESFFRQHFNYCENWFYLQFLIIRCIFLMHFKLLQRQKFDYWINIFFDWKYSSDLIFTNWFTKRVYGILKHFATSKSLKIFLLPSYRSVNCHTLK